MFRRSEPPARAYFQRARDEAWAIVHPIVPHATREMIDRPADVNLFFWIQTRGAGHASGHQLEEPTLAEFVALLTLGMARDHASGEWREVGVPEF